jgi:hypothetical protein
MVPVTVLGGIATSLLYSAFESWLVAEHCPTRLLRCDLWLERGLNAMAVMHINQVHDLLVESAAAAS